MVAPERTVGLILAAGAASRFGSPKVLASLGGATLLERVVAAARSGGLTRISIVLGPEGEAALRSAGVDLPGVQLVTNPRPEDGLSSSLRVGLASLDGDIEAALVLLADQPLVAPDAIASILAAEVPPGRDIVVPRYANGGGPNPALLLRDAWALADGLTGDRGMAPVIAARPERVVEVSVKGDNPDVDTRDDLVDVVLADWARQVRENREQVDRVREVPDGDFYASTRSLFIADPRRPSSDDPVLAALRDLARPTDTWLDIGAGAGRYALPLALVARDVVAVDPSPSMLASLRAGMDEHGIANVEIVEGRWPAVTAPDGRPLHGDVALIAHVGYDIEAIGPFLDALEDASGRLCVAVMTDRTPASLAEPFWPIVHGEPRIPLPAMPAFADLLRARGRPPEVRVVEHVERTFHDRDEILGFLRRQTWVTPDGPRDRRLQAALDERLAPGPDGGVIMRGAPPLEMGVATWEPLS